MESRFCDLSARFPIGTKVQIGPITWLVIDNKVLLTEKDDPNSLKVCVFNEHFAIRSVQEWFDKIQQSTEKWDPFKRRIKPQVANKIMQLYCDELKKTAAKMGHSDKSLASMIGVVDISQITAVIKRGNGYLFDPSKFVKLAPLNASEYGNYRKQAKRHRKLFGTTAGLSIEMNQGKIPYLESIVTLDNLRLTENFKVLKRKPRPWYAMKKKVHSDKPHMETDQSYLDVDDESKQDEETMA